MGLAGLPGLELVVKLVVVSWTRRGLSNRLLLLLRRDKVSRYLEVYIRRITWRGRSLRAVSGDVRPKGDVREEADRVSSCLLGLNMLGGSLKGPPTTSHTACNQGLSYIFF